jgi:hypothetical protein
MTTEAPSRKSGGDVEVDKSLILAYAARQAQDEAEADRAAKVWLFVATDAQLVYA